MPYNFTWDPTFAQVVFHDNATVIQSTTMPSVNQTSYLMSGMTVTYNWGVLFLTPIVLFGITGNILVCMAVSMEKRLQTVTNYFLLSLAITDLLVCIIVMPISIINEFYGYWPFNSALCNLFITSDVLMSTSSILHLCSISLQRYLAIRNPLKSRNKSKSIVILKISFIWVTAATISSPVTALGIMDEKNILNKNHCLLKNNDFIIYGSILSFVIPLVIMVLSYALTIRLLLKQSKLCDPNSANCDSDQPIIRRSTSRRHKGRRGRPTSTTSWSSSTGQSTYEMGYKNRSNLNISHSGENYLQLPNVISHTTSCDSLFTSPKTTSSKRMASSACYLNVPGMEQDESSSESLISDPSIDEDNNRSNKSFRRGSPGKRSFRDVMTKQIMIKASSILNIARDRNQDKMAVRTEQKASKVLGFVFALFIVCWAPFFGVNILTVLCKSCSFDPVLITVFVWLGWVSSTINPIIYTMFNSTFKQTFVKLLKCQYGFLQKSGSRRHWNTSNGYGNKESSDSNAEIPL